MHFSIEHLTEYRFERQVFIEPHRLCFQPRASGNQRILRFDLTIEPTPAGVCHSTDAEGNAVAFAWFDGLHERLGVRAVSEVETLQENPFDYLLTARNINLPVEYAPAELEMLVAARRRDVTRLRDDPILKWAEKISDEAGGETAPFLNRLTEAIYKKFTVVHREDGPSWPPTTTFEFGRGACRDLAVLFVDGCRAVGLAARFVSGYQEGDPNQDHRDLHAWAEVYIPDAGWRGYDPTLGLAVADGHVAVAASAEPALAAPLVGTFRGTGVKAEFHSHVQIQTGEPAATMWQSMG